MSKSVKRIFLWLFTVPAVLAVAAAWLIWGGVSNPANRGTIGEIKTPRGFERVEVESGSFGEFIRQFPLQERGSHMSYSDGRIALGQGIGYAVLDLPLLSDTEQCADAVMRMRAEYLWQSGRYGSIHFHSVSGKDQRYTGGADRKAFERYLIGVYGNSNTSSLRRELNSKPFKDIVPGDVFVYESSRPGYYGHAVLVADVAKNAKTGQTAVMLAQSSTPALTMHIIRDIPHPFRSPWIILDDSDKNLYISGFIHFYMSDLRGYKNHE